MQGRLLWWQLVYTGGIAVFYCPHPLFYGLFSGCKHSKGLRSTAPPQAGSESELGTLAKIEYSALISFDILWDSFVMYIRNLTKCGEMVIGVRYGNPIPKGVYM